MNARYLCNITLTGKLGAGKTTIAKLLGKQGWDWVSSGKLFRAAAEDSGIDVVKLNDALTKPNGLDEEIDKITVALARTPGHVFDSRMAWHFAAMEGCAPVFRVLLVCDPSIAARRVLADGNRSSERYSSYEESIVKLAERQRLERERFMDIYGGLDYLNERNHDFMIDTTEVTPREAADRIGEELRLHVLVD